MCWPPFQGFILTFTPQLIALNIYFNTAAVLINTAWKKKYEIKKTFRILFIEQKYLQIKHAKGESTSHGFKEKEV